MATATVPCDLVGCDLPALLVHSVGCGAVVCALHAEPFGDCPVCGSAWELAS